jgi:hypothetical protein
MIVAANQVDQQLYDFVERELYPSFREQYGPSLDKDVAAFQAQRWDFNNRNIALSRMKQYSVHKPLLYAYRHALTKKAVVRLLGPGRAP